LIFSYLGVIVELMQGLGTRALARRLGEASVARIGVFLMALRLAGNSLGYDAVFLLPPLALLGVGFGAVQPSILSLNSRHSAVHPHGQVLRVSQSIRGPARIMVPLPGVWVFDPVSARGARGGAGF